MRRAIWVPLLLLAGGFCLYAQGGGEPEGKAAHQVYWLWANFVLLAAGLGYLIGKHAPGFFRSRTDEIRKGIEEAAKLKKEAETRAAEMDRRMSALESEIQKLRQEAHAETAAEGDRVRAETAELLAKVKRQGEREVAALASHARQELKAYAAELATQLAAERIRARMTGAVADELVADFVSGLEKQGSQN